MYVMPAAQSPHEIRDILDRLVGRTITELHVFGINSLKSVTPTPADLTGARIDAVSVEDRMLELRTQAYTVAVDLQRTGRLVWFSEPPSAVVGPVSRPTVRVLLQSGNGVDFTEPAKTKRISVKIARA